MAILYDRYLGPGWNEDPDNEKTWRRAEKIPDAELWRTHERCRTRLVNHARKRLVRQLESQGAPLRALEEAEKVLDPEALTVGFARRIDTFRRATLLFKDLDRLEKLLNNPGRPVQLIFAGKAHPADNAGKELIRTIVQTARQERFRNRIVFIEDYDINVGRYMVQGTDVWLNTPRRPHQACGTSGMKAAANGGLNLSILDGWWDEAYLGDNGWAIGWREEYADPGQQDDIESRALYDLLEESVNPLFYERGADDLPREWIQMMKRSIGSICPIFNSHRMVTQYVENFYMPTAANSSKLRDNNYKALKEMVAWKRRILDDWDKISILTVEIRNEESALRGKNVQVVVTVDTAGHHPEELSVVLVHGPIDLWDNFKVRHITRLEPDSTNADSGGPVRFSGLVPLSHTGLYGYTVRATPQHPNLSFSKRFEVVCRG
jgi:starch phosphorylase